MPSSSQLAGALAAAAWRTSCQWGHLTQQVQLRCWGPKTTAWLENKGRQTGLAARLYRNAHLGELELSCPSFSIMAIIISSCISLAISAHNQGSTRGSEQALFNSEVRCQGSCSIGSQRRQFVAAQMLHELTAAHSMDGFSLQSEHRCALYGCLSSRPCCCRCDACHRGGAANRKCWCCCCKAAHTATCYCRRCSRCRPSSLQCLCAHG